MLTPILVAGFGRSGTTALMQLVLGDPRVAADRLYPYENRYLTYIAKLTRIAGVPSPRPELHAIQLCDYDDLHFGAVPWPANRDATPRLAVPPEELFRTLWAATSARSGGATHYAEKAPAWLPAWLRPRLPSATVHLVRDPRDVFLSAVAFLREKGFERGFGRDAATSDLDHARNLAHALLLYHENERADRGRVDCVRVRYEDFVADRTAVAGRLSQLTGLSFPAEGGDEHLGRHRTSADPVASVGRWKREGLPRGVRELLESHLGELLADNGYDPPATPPSARFALAADGRHSPDGEWSPDGDGLAVALHGPDAWLELPAEPFPAKGTREVWACVRGDAGERCAIYWRRAREDWHEHRSAGVPFHPGGHWQVVRLPVAANAHWHGTIAQVRLDAFKGATAGRGTVRWLRRVG